MEDSEPSPPPEKPPAHLALPYEEEEMESEPAVSATEGATLSSVAPTVGDVLGATPKSVEMEEPDGVEEEPVALVGVSAVPMVVPSAEKWEDVEALKALENGVPSSTWGVPIRTYDMELSELPKPPSTAPAFLGTPVPRLNLESLRAGMGGVKTFVEGRVLGAAEDTARPTTAQTERAWGAENVGPRGRRVKQLIRDTEAQLTERGRKAEKMRLLVLGDRGLAQVNYAPFRDTGPKPNSVAQQLVGHPVARGGSAASSVGARRGKIACSSAGEPGYSSLFYDAQHRNRLSMTFPRTPRGLGLDSDPDPTAEEQSQAECEPELLQELPAQMGPSVPAPPAAPRPRVMRQAYRRNSVAAEFMAARKPAFGTSTTRDPGKNLVLRLGTPSQTGPGRYEVPSRYLVAPRRLPDNCRDRWGFLRSTSSFVTTPRGEWVRSVSSYTGSGQGKDAHLEQDKRAWRRNVAVRMSSKEQRGSAVPRTPRSARGPDPGEYELPRWPADARRLQTPRVMQAGFPLIGPKSYAELDAYLPVRQAWEDR